MLERIARIAATLIVASWLPACSQGAHDGAPYLGVDPDAGPSGTIPNGDRCETPNLGCACERADELAECGKVERRSGDYVSCSLGHRRCTDGEWTECIGDRIATMSDPMSDRRNQGLGMTQGCADNPCDPYCQRVVDDSIGLSVPDGGALSVDAGLTLKQNVPLPSGSGCTSLSLTPTPQTVTVTAINTTFVKGEYFNQFSKSVTSIPTSWPVTATRLESNIDFDWGSAAPGPSGIGADGFSVRWTGSVIPTTTGAYTFYTESDDGARLWINGSLLIDKWQDQGPTEYASTTVNLTAGTPALFRYEYFENSGGASAKLRWSSSSAAIAKQIIPAANLAGPSGTRTRLTVTPANPQFNAGLLPSGCFAGALNPAWALDRYDVATVTNGAINLISAVPGALNLTAYAGGFSATGLLNVLVNATDSTAAPTNAVSNFAKTAAGTDPMKVLYPYDKTVLPTGLTAPVVQWDTGGTAATAVKLTLSYPATGTPSFSWSVIVPETVPPSATIPQAIWKDFENTGKGQDVKFSVQRVLGSTPAPAVSRTLHFSSSPVRGLIYYTQYQRNGATDMMVADPGTTSTARTAFATTNGCPVCHSVSANGNYFATADRSSSTNGGLSKVQADGVLSPLADFVPDPARSTYRSGAADWRGFAWAPLTPDGKYALSANNIWGNTNQAIVGIDTSTRTVSVPATITSGGSGTGLLTQYFPNKTFTVASPLWKRIEPIVNYDYGILAPSLVIPIDFSVRRTGLIQAHTSETYLFEIETSDGVKLTVNGNVVINQLGFQAGLLSPPSTFSGSLAMTAGSKVSIQLDQLDSAVQSSIKLYWSSPTVPRTLVPQSQLYPNDGIHGLDVNYYANNSNTPPVALNRLEPDVNAYWGANSPASESNLPSDNFSSTWQGQLESPYTGLVIFCIDADDGVKMTLGGNVIINRTSFISLDWCSLPQLLTQGQMYSLRLDHVEKTGNAQLNLRWNYGLLAIAERIPTANLYPPVGYAAPTSGLTATYYGDTTLGKSYGLNPAIQNAFTRTDPNIYADFGNGRTEYSQLTSSDYWSARWTGLLSAPCSGMYEFQTLNNVDDGGRLWIDQTRIASQWSYGALYGSTYLKAGDHDFKFDWYEGNGGAAALLQWKVNCAGAGWTAIPNSAFKPTGDSGRAGGGRDGGDNGNGSKYTIWQTPTTAGVDPIDVTASSPNNWGLSNTVMMVPSFAPDSSKLVFVDGDSAGGAGWRKGLSTFDFDQTGKIFKNRRSIVNTWPFGDAIKWPAFESDSHSVIYQSTVPADVCCRRTAWTQYGFMGPTNYYEDPGRLWSVDSTSANPTPVALTALNAGERPVDANKVYQPTMAPQAAGGYRWVVYTSTRPYGNTFNQESIQADYSNTGSYSAMMNYNDVQSQLWVSAIDDTPSGATDRSHPGFWLPNQKYASTGTNGYVNERGFWVLEGCKATGKSCEVDEDCCGGTASPKTSLCRLDTPVSDPPTRHCAAAPSIGMCVAQGGACSSNSDCCSNSVCITGACAAPPPILVYGAANFERVYTASCGEGTKPVWRFFDWQTVTPSNSKIEFYAQSAASASSFSTLPVAPAAVSTTGVVSLGSASGATISSWTGGNVGAALIVAGLKSQPLLKVTARLIPNTALTAAPTLTNWRQNYSCVPAE